MPNNPAPFPVRNAKFMALDSLRRAQLLSADRLSAIGTAIGDLGKRIPDGDYWNRLAAPSAAAIDKAVVFAVAIFETSGKVNETNRDGKWFAEIGRRHLASGNSKIETLDHLSELATMTNLARRRMDFVDALVKDRPADGIAAAMDETDFHRLIEIAPALQKGLAAAQPPPPAKPVP